MSITYRYRCQTEGALVYETRGVADPVPTTCVNEGGALVTGSLTIVEQPTDVSDLVVKSTVDFAGATVSNLSHTSLTDVGTNTHAQIDTHLADVSKHRVINDVSTAATDLWSAAKISTELAGKSATSHTHTASDVTDFNSAADARITAQKAQANGLATLGADSKIPSAQLPALAITNVHVVADIAARDALTVEEGDVVKVADDGNGHMQTYIWDGSVWVMITETSDVLSVNGATGAVVLTSSDVSEGTNLYYTTGRVTAHPDVSANTTHRSATNNPHSVTIDQVTSASTKGDLIGHSGSAHVVQAVGTNGQVLQADSTQTSGLRWVNNKKFIVSSKNTSTASSQWTRMDHFIYPGSVIDPTKVSRILVNADADSGVTYKMRIYDVTNSLEVALVTGKTNLDPEMINMGTLSNIPSSDAMFEVQIARTAGLLLAGAVYSSVMLEYQ